MQIITVKDFVEAGVVDKLLVGYVHLFGCSYTSIELTFPL